MAVVHKRVGTPHLRVKGFKPDFFASNNRIVTSQAATTLARGINSLIGRRTKILASDVFPEISGTSGSTVYSRGRFKTSPGTFYHQTSNTWRNFVQLHVTLLPVNGTLSTIQPRITLQTQNITDAESALTTMTWHCNRRISGAATISDAQHITFAPNESGGNYDGPGLVGDKDYAYTFTVVDYAEPLHFVLWENVIPTLSVDSSDLTAGNAVHPMMFGDGQEILNQPIQNLWDVAHEKWKSGRNIFNWSKDDGTSTDLTTSTFTNPLDGSSTAWGTDAPGFIAIPKKSGYLHSTNVPINCYTYAEHTGAGSGEVRFVVNGSTICTIGSISSAAWYSGTGNLNSANSTDKIDVLARSTSTGTVKVYSLCANEGS